MSAEHDRKEEAIASLAVKREGPRFRLTVIIRLRREDLEGGLLEERAATEDIGLSGAMVLASAPFLEGDIVDVEELGGAFHVRARVVGATLGEDNVTRLNLLFLGDDAADRAGELLRRHGLLVSGRLTLQSEIPPSHPAKDAV